MGNDIETCRVEIICQLRKDDLVGVIISVGLELESSQDKRGKHSGAFVGSGVKNVN